MKKIVRLTESQLINVIKRVISEQESEFGVLNPKYNLPNETKQISSKVGNSGTYQIQDGQFTFSDLSGTKRYTLPIPSISLRINPPLSKGRFTISGSTLALFGPGKQQFNNTGTI